MGWGDAGGSPARVEGRWELRRVGGRGGRVSRPRDLHVSRQVSKEGPKTGRGTGAGAVKLEWLYSPQHWGPGQTHPKGQGSPRGCGLDLEQFS